MKKRFLILLSLFLFSNIAFAGGLQAATNAMSEFQLWLYGFMGSFAFIYLSIKFIQLFLEQIRWPDVGMAVLKIAGAGAVAFIVTWAWNIGK